MFAEVQARDQLSKCSLSGSAHGELKMSLSVLNEVITAHSSGSVTMSAHRTRKPWEKTLRVLPVAFSRGAGTGAALVTGALSPAVPAGGVSVVFTRGLRAARSVRCASVLQPLAAAQPHHDGHE